MNEASFAHILFATRVPRKPIRHTQGRELYRTAPPFRAWSFTFAAGEPEVGLSMGANLRIGVVGAGFAGLYTVFFLRKFFPQGIDITLFVFGVAEVYGRQFKGLPAWFIWKAFKLGMLPRAKNRLQIVADWLITLLFKRDTSKLI